MSNDIFISYRRQGAGFGVAGELQTRLMDKGYQVFLDVDKIGSGNFPEQIEHAIEECNDFIFVLSPGFFDRCSDEADWVRRELMLAIQHEKNMIGVSLPGFVMPEPEELPEPLRSIPSKQVFLWSHEYRGASLEKIAENMVSAQKKKKRKRRNSVWIFALLAAAGLGAWLLMPNKVAEEPVAVVETPQKVAVMDTIQMVRDSFAAYVYRGDSLLALAPNPVEEADYVLFMEGLGSYDAAMDISKRYPAIALVTATFSDQYEYLLRLRKEWFDRELSAASKFVEVDQMEFARYRFANAKVLALPTDEKALASVERKLK